MAGAPEGNHNATKNKPWTAAINRALAQNPDKLRALADKLIDKAIEGDLPSMKEIGDRIEGKPVTTIAGDPENPLQTLAEIKVKLVGTDSGDT